MKPGIEIKQIKISGRKYPGNWRLQVIPAHLRFGFPKIPWPVGNPAWQRIKQVEQAATEGKTLIQVDAMPGLKKTTISNCVKYGIVKPVPPE
jgi:hypothetical protein